MMQYYFKLVLKAVYDNPTIKDLDFVKSFHTITDTNGYTGLSKSGSVLYIVFRGTEAKLTDILIDIMFLKSTIPYYPNVNKKIRVHSGFMLAYYSIREHIHDEIKKHANIKKVVCLGHSLGGALATLCSLDVKYNFSNLIVQNYNFGCPRVGNKYFVQSYLKRIILTTRVVNNDDVVTNIPYTFLGYRHIGREKHIGKKKKWYNRLIPWHDLGKHHHLSEYKKEIFI